MNTRLEASYPTSHTMIVVCILVTAMMRFKNVFKDMKGILSIVNIISVFMIGVTVAGRLVRKKCRLSQEEVAEKLSDFAYISERGQYFQLRSEAHKDA